MSKIGHFVSVRLRPLLHYTGLLSLFIFSLSSSLPVGATEPDKAEDPDDYTYSYCAGFRDGSKGCWVYYPSAGWETIEKALKKNSDRPQIIKKKNKKTGEVVETKRYAPGEVYKGPAMDKPATPGEAPTTDEPPTIAPPGVRDSPQPSGSDLSGIVRIGKVWGEVEVIREGSDAIKVTGGEMVLLTDKIYTGLDSGVEIVGSDGETATVGELTEMSIRQMGESRAERIRRRLYEGAVRQEEERQREKDRALGSRLTGTTIMIFLPNGRVSFHTLTGVGTRSPRPLGTVITPTATCSIRGTTYSVSHSEKPSPLTIVEVQKGEVFVTPNNEAMEPVLVRAGGKVWVSDEEIKTQGDVVALSEVGRETQKQSDDGGISEDIVGQPQGQQEPSQQTQVSKLAGPRLVLREIIKDDASTLTVEKVDLNAKNGFVEFTVPYGGGCLENYRFEYRFDQDMSTLEFGEGRGAAAREYGFNVSLQVVKGDCKRSSRNPFGNATASDGGFSKVLNRMFKEKPDTYKKRVKLIGGNSPRVYAYPGKTVKNLGSARGRFVTYKYKNSYDSYYSWFGFSISAGQTYEIGFIYQQEK